MVETCLYYRFKGETLLNVLVYVDDLFVAKNKEQCKSMFVMDLNDAYGIVDQGLLTDYLSTRSSSIRSRSLLSNANIHAKFKHYVNRWTLMLW